MAILITNGPSSPVALPASGRCYVGGTIFSSFTYQWVQVQSQLSVNLQIGRRHSEKAGKQAVFSLEARDQARDQAWHEASRRIQCTISMAVC